MAGGVVADARLGECGVVAEGSAAQTAGFFKDYSSSRYDRSRRWAVALAVLDLSGRNEASAMVLVARRAGDFMGRRIFLGRSKASSSKAERSRRTAAGLCGKFAGAGGASDLAAAKRLVVVSDAVCDFADRIFWTNHLVRVGSIVGLVAAAASDFRSVLHIWMFLWLFWI